MNQVLAPLGPRQLPECFLFFWLGEALKYARVSAGLSLAWRASQVGDTLESALYWGAVAAAEKSDDGWWEIQKNGLLLCAGPGCPAFDCAAAKLAASTQGGAA